MRHSALPPRELARPLFPGTLSFCSQANVPESFRSKTSESLRCSSLQRSAIWQPRLRRYVHRRGVGYRRLQLRMHQLRVFISTGEVSGDMHGAALATSLRRLASERAIPSSLLLRGVGGPAMREAGVDLYANTLNISSIGIFEAVRFIVPAFLAYEKAKKELLEDPPDVAVLIDYIGPNAAIASWFREFLPGVPVIYYIGPQQWIWESEGNPAPRLLDYFPVLRACCRCLVAIFPLEAEFYRQKLQQLGALDSPPEIVYVGHPIVDLVEPMSLETARATLAWDATDRIYVAVMLASREQEVRALLPDVARTAVAIEKTIRERYPGKRIHFIIPIAREEFTNRIRNLLVEQGIAASRITGQDRTRDSLDPESLFHLVPRSQSRLVLAAADIAICKSGTVNLEAAALGVPQIVLYRLSGTSAFLIRHVFRMQLPYVSAVNVVSLDRPIVPELLQENLTTERLYEEAIALLENRDGCADRMREAYRSEVIPRLRLADEVRDAKRLSAADRAAAVVWRYLEQVQRTSAYAF
jgi:lipid-A-disaccharide synthase